MKPNIALDDEVTPLVAVEADAADTDCAVVLGRKEKPDVVCCGCCWGNCGMPPKRLAVPLTVLVELVVVGRVSDGGAG